MSWGLTACCKEDSGVCSNEVVRNRTVVLTQLVAALSFVLPASPHLLPAQTVPN